MSEVLTVRSRLREYSVEFTNEIAPRLQADAEQGISVVDRDVLALYPDVFADVPEERIFPLEATERNKTLEQCQALLGELVERGFRRGSSLVAVGGGVVQDVTAFVASILYRGVDWVFYPTTLLAQADSCIGSKTSINMGGYKNLLGNFYPPTRIVSVPAFLETLPEREIRSGIGEMLHFYLIADSDLTHPMMEEYDALVAEPRRLKPYILESLAIKQPVVERDEFDRGERLVFNYGHTFGHAIEAITDYGVSHGQAVTLGMDLANHISRELGWITDETYEAMHSVLRKNLPDFQLEPSQFEAYIAALARDKKNRGSQLGCILTRGPGHMELTHLPLDARLRDWVADFFGVEAPASA